ncbi:MAG: hypothetical protein ACP5JW_06840 [Candidatus Bathyarchaeia archaeon]
MSLLWTEELALFSWLSLRLIHLVILGDILLISGATLWVSSCQWFVVLGKTIWFHVPARKNGDQSEIKALVHCPTAANLSTENRRGLTSFAF